MPNVQLIKYSISFLLSVSKIVEKIAKEGLSTFLEDYVVTIA